MRNRALAVCVSSLLGSTFAITIASSSACNSLDEPGVQGTAKLVVPTDVRPVQQALRTPPPISGGTLAISPDGAYAIAADPDRDRVSVVSLSLPTGASVRQIELEQGSEPGRVVAGTDGRAYVALRGSGELLTIDVRSAAVMARTRACAAPRGMALTPDQSRIYLACAEGRLLTLDTGDQSVVRDLHVRGDLRDVLVDSAGHVRVSTFKSSELLSLDDNGVVMARTAPVQTTLVSERPASEVEGVDALQLRHMQPDLAWRTLSAPNGATLMLHQVASTDEIDIQHKATQTDSVQSSSPYGGSGNGLEAGCPGVVVTTVSRVDPNGANRSFGIAGTVLNVDMALSPRGELAVVEAGTADPNAPRPHLVEANGELDMAPPMGPGFAPDFGVGESRSSILRFSAVDAGGFGSVMAPPPPLEGGSNDVMGCSFPSQVVPAPGQATAVAYAPNGDLVVQSREPALISVFADNSLLRAPPIDLGGDSVLDTGHDLFHRNSGGGIACASCHAEGAEDGHVWNFKGQGLRRTQALHVGLAGTAPFHWRGDESDLGALMEDVFVGRMGGVHQSTERVQALTRFLFALHPPTPMRAADDPAAMRGKALFESSAVGCIGCHNGDKLTDNHNYDVGTSDGEALQVPSLHGVAYRAPFIHTGCAQTLEQRFDPTCGGGSKHGNTANLDPEQVEDLVSYLQTL
jgi:hypothetical protein